MANNKSKAQVNKAFAAAGIVQPNMKLDANALQAHIGRRAAIFEDKRTKRNRDRSSQKRRAIQDF